MPDDTAASLADEGMKELPSDLNRAARRAINQGGQVNLSGRSKLARWAATERAAAARERRLLV